MELYFLRHAIAAEPGTVSVAHDSERPLTPEGIEKMEKVAQGMRRLEISVNHVVSSPYVRAAHTAKIVAKGIEFNGKIKYSDALVPNAEFKSFLKLLNEFKPNEKVLFVGHMPSIGDFTSLLLFGDASSQIDYQKGGLCRIDLPDLSKPKVMGQLKWFITTKHLRLFT
jgi:phosphohistidine phosphatase